MREKAQICNINYKTAKNAKNIRNHAQKRKTLQKNCTKCKIMLKTAQNAKRWAKTQKDAK